MMRLILLGLTVGACSPPSPSSRPPGALRPGMTEQQVVEVSENRVPDWVVQRTCGNETAAPFPCQIYVYEGARREGRSQPKLSIVFEKVGGQWLVSQWL